MQKPKPGSIDLISKIAMITFIAMSAWGSVLLAESTLMAIGSLVLHLTGMGLIGFVNLPATERSQVAPRPKKEPVCRLLPEPKTQLARQ